MIALTQPLRGAASAFRTVRVAALTVQNLFAQRPPFFDSRGAVGYDPANYEPTGRAIALQLTKVW